VTGHAAQPGAARQHAHRWGCHALVRSSCLHSAVTAIGGRAASTDLGPALAGY
jgi:hypothetical protein